MLTLLHIENIAVVERADIEPGSGLNILTGETGAGKSYYRCYRSNLQVNAPTEI